MAKEVAKPAGPTELSLIPPTRFFIVCDMNTMQAQGPIDTDTEAKYKAAELSTYATGPKPIGVFQYVGGVTKQREPLFWTEATEEPRK